MITQMETEQNTIQVGHIFQIIHTKCYKYKKSGSGKTNALLNLINKQPEIEKIYLYAKDPYESKYQYLIKTHETVGVIHFSDPEACIKYANDTQDVYENIDE